MTLIGCGFSIFAPLLARETYEEVRRERPDVILTGSPQRASPAFHATSEREIDECKACRAATYAASTS